MTLRNFEGRGEEEVLLREVSDTNFGGEGGGDGVKGED